MRYEDIPIEVRQRLIKKFGNMRRRCYLKTNKDYRLYGGKGITIYEDWLRDPHEFVIWAVNHGYKLGLTIERRDNDKGYAPDNCAFIPMSQQPLNTARNRFISYKGKILTISQVARLENVSDEAIRKRIKHGWYEEVENPNKIG